MVRADSVVGRQFGCSPIVDAELLEPSRGCSGGRVWKTNCLRRRVGRGPIKWRECQPGIDIDERVAVCNIFFVTKKCRTYIVPTFHEEPPYLLWIYVTRWSAIKLFHDFGLSPVDLEVSWGRTVSWITGVGRADIGDFEHHV